jgi:hypothetical protein
MKPVCCRPRRTERAWAFALLLALLALSCLVLTSCKKQADESPDTAVVDRTEGGYAPGQIRPEPAQSVPGKAVQRAIGHKCQENLRQVRMLIMSAKMDSEDGTHPASLTALPEAARISSCPLGHEAYTYDPATGEVHCPHPGHEKY